MFCCFAWLEAIVLRSFPFAHLAKTSRSSPSEVAAAFIIFRFQIKEVRAAISKQNKYLNTDAAVSYRLNGN